MKFAFVRFIEIDSYGKEVSDLPCVEVVSGEKAESREDFISFRAGVGAPVAISNWCEVPEHWENTVTRRGQMNDVFEALIGLDALTSDAPFVSDLLATIFEVGFKCGERHHWDVQSAFARGSASRK